MGSEIIRFLWNLPEKYEKNIKYFLKYKKYFIFLTIFVVLLVSLFVYRNKNFFSYNLSVAHSCEIQAAKCWYNFDITNNSQDNKILSQIHYINWKNRFLSDYYIYGERTFLDNKIDEIKLPLLFNSKEQKRIGLHFTILGQSNLDFFQKNSQDLNFFKNIEIILEDEKGILYDKNGKLISKQLLKSWEEYNKNSNIKTISKIIWYRLIDLFKNN